MPQPAGYVLCTVKDPLEIIATRRHGKLAAKEEIYRLLDDSYKGGFQYIRETT